MAQIRHAELSQREEIALLWKDCFGEHREAIDYFLANVFSPEHCLVQVVKERVVAMVHMLPADIISEAGTVQAHYIYAAATDSAFRSQGLMGQLLNEAFSYGESRGDVCSFLLPSEPSLYDYYARYGYTPYFRTRFAEISTAELASLPILEGEQVTASRGEKLGIQSGVSLLRNDQLSGERGSILWPHKYLDYAMQVNSIYGGETSSLSGTDGRLEAYALHAAAGSDCTEITEIFAADWTWLELLRYISGVTGSGRLRLRLPENSPILPGLGEVRDFGMVRPLGRHTVPAPLAGRSPYLGLTLD